MNQTVFKYLLLIAPSSNRHTDTHNITPPHENVMESLFEENL